jgi:epoxide hydrolase
MSTAQSSNIRPFRVAVPKQTLDRILARVRDMHWPERIDAGNANGWQYGVNYDYLKELAAYWTTRFDWRKAEERLNRYPQFMARVEDFDLHFYHVRGRGPQPVPLVLTHGWPGSVVEFLEAIGPLTDPASFGGSADDAFDVVIPSLPGFGFSSKPKGKPVGPVTTARLWHKLMTEVLGYKQYGAQGGDWGNAVTYQLAVQFPGEMIGIHLNATGVRPIPENERTEEESTWLRNATVYRQLELDYFNEQTHKPQTVAFALSDNPIGTAAWIVEKLKSWSDSGEDLDRTLSKDQVLTNVMWYLVSETSGSAVWFYRGNADEPTPPRTKMMVPTGFAAFPAEMTVLAPPRSALERDFNLIHYTKMPHGGHFACFEQPKLFVDDVRTFFRKLRS